MYPELDSAITRDLDRIYRACAPELTREPDQTEATIQQREMALRASGCFDRFEVQRFPWSARYSTEQYIGLLNTYSDHLMLADESRARLFDAVAQVINQRGGFIDRPYLATLYLARKANE
jgi:hypothetical protein